LGETILRRPDGRGSIWERTRRRKRERRKIGKVKFGVRSSELRDFSETVGRTIILWMAQRMRINRIPSSIKENAQSSTEPKAMGVKTMREIMMNLIRELIIA
jgi:flagellar biosynthesis protein FlhB